MIGLKKKSNIRVEKAARLTGILDEFGILEEGEVYCQVLRDDEEAPLIID